MKLAVVLYAADYTVRKHAVMKSFQRGLLPMLAVMLLVSWLLLREPDFGALVVIAVIAFGDPVPRRHERPPFRRAASACWRPASRCWCVSSPYRMQRIFGFMDPVVGSLRQGLPAVARADRLRPRRMARRRPGRERGEAALPARGAHRFPARGDRRGARLRRRGAGDRAVRLARARAPSPSAARPACTSATSPRSPRRASASGSASRRSSTWA